MRKRWIVAICMFFGFPAFPQTLVSEPDKDLNGLVADVIRLVIHPTVSLLTPDQRRILSDVDIHITDGFSVFGPQAGYDQDGGKVVYIPLSHLALQRDYIWSVVIGGAYNTPYFPEYWIEHALTRLSDNFDITRGGHPPHPKKFFGLDDETSEELFEFYGASVFGFLSSAITDILLHELSHFIVEDGIFDWTTTDPERAIEIELSADRFSSYLHSIYIYDVLQDTRYPDVHNLMGRIFSVGLMDEMQDYRSIANDAQTIRYPDLAQRIEGSRTAANCADEEVRYFCSIAEERVAVSESRKIIVDHYEERAEEGELFAIYRLARYFWAGNRKEKACEYLNADTSGHAWAHGINQVLWANCLDASLVWKEKSRGDRLSEAARYYCAAWREGFNTYQNYRDIVDFLDWPDTCSDTPR